MTDIIQQNENPTIEGYEVLNTVASTDRSVVYMVEDSESKKTYALKLIKSNPDREPNEILVEALSEAVLMHHINTVVETNIMPELIKFGITNEGYPYLLMELLPGNLDTYIQDNLTEQDPKEKLQILEDLAAKLEVLVQNGILYTDITPDNILLTDNNEVRLGDAQFIRFLKLGHMTELIQNVVNANPKMFRIDLGNLNIDVANEIESNIALTPAFSHPLLRYITNPRAIINYPFAIIAHKLLAKDEPTFQNGTEGLSVTSSELFRYLNELGIKSEKIRYSGHGLEANIRARFERIFNQNFEWIGEKLTVHSQFLNGSAMEIVNELKKLNS